MKVTNKFNAFKEKFVSGFLTSYLILVFIPVVIGCGAYISIEKSIEKEAMRINDTIIEQIGESIDQDIYTIYKICEQIISNTQVNDYSVISKPIHANNYFVIREIADDVQNTALLSNYIEGVFTYFPKSNIIVYKGAVYDPSSFFTYRYYTKEYDYEDFYEQILCKSHTPRLMDVGISSRGKEQNNLLYCMTLPGSGLQPKANVFVIIDSERFSGSYRQYADIYSESYIGILLDQDDANGMTLAGNQDRINQMRSNPDLNKDYIVSTYHSINSSWEYIMISPIREVLSPVRKIRNKALFSVLGYLIINTIFAVLLSNHNYAPIRTLVNSFRSIYGNYSDSRNHGDKKFLHGNYRNNIEWMKDGIIEIAKENNHAKKQISDLLPVARNNYIISLISDPLVPNRLTRIPEELALFDMEFFSNRFMVALLVIDYSCMPQSSSMTISFVIDELIGQSISPYGKCYVANLANRDLAVLFNLREQANEADVIQACQQLLDRLRAGQGIKGQIYLGNEYSDMQNIYRSYIEAKEALSYRYLYHAEQVIAFRQVVRSKVLPKYTHDMEIKLENMLITGNTGEAEGIIDEIYKINFIDNRIDPQMAHCLMMDIFSSVLRISDSLGIDMYRYLKHDDENNELMPLKLGANVQSTMYWFKLLFGIICDHVKSSHAHEDKNENLKCRIKGIMETEMFNPDLNQSYIAGKLHISAPYLSYLFKDIFGVNMSQFISKKRCERAADLLRETSKTLNEIAKDVGVLDSASLIRIFKKFYGITPGQYRKQKGKQTGINLS